MRSGSAQAAAAAAAASRAEFGAAEVDQVVAGTGCCDRDRIQRVLEQCGGSVDQAIEQLIEQLGEEPEEGADGGGSGDVPAQPQAGPAAGDQQATVGGQEAQHAGGDAGPEAEGAQQGAAAAQQQQLGDDSIRIELQPLPGNPSRICLVLHATPAAGAQQGEEAQQAAGTAAAQDASEEADGGGKRGGKRAGKGVKVKHKVEHPGRNQKCPCGSGKKVKNCCGAARARHGAVAVEEADSSGAVAATVQQLQVLHI